MRGVLQVLVVSNAIAATGLDMLLDVHGDEEIPANFIGSMFGVRAWGPRLERMQKAFVGALLVNTSMHLLCMAGMVCPIL